MTDEEKTREQLIVEVEGLRQRIAQLEAAASLGEQAVIAMRANQERFRRIIDAIPVPIIISKKSDNTILYANDHFSTLVGLPPGEAVGRRTLDFFFDRADQRGFARMMERDGCIGGYEFRAKRADGGALWLVTSTQTMMFEGEDTYISGFNDITAGRWAQEALRESEEQYRLLIDSYDGPITLFDREGVVLLINAPARATSIRLPQTLWERECKTYFPTAAKDCGSGTTQ